MPILTLEPRDAGVLDPGDLTVEFEDQSEEHMYGIQACGATRALNTFKECYETVP